MPDTPTRAANVDRVRAVLPFAGPDLDSVIEQLDDRGLAVLAALVEAPAYIEQSIRARVMLELSAVSPQEGGPFASHTPAPDPQGPGLTRAVERRDRYTIVVDEYAMRATPDQEAQIRAMDDAGRARLRRIMGDTRG